MIPALKMPKESSSTIIVLEAGDVFDTLASVKSEVAVTVLDPWYNRGIGGIDPNYDVWVRKLVKAALEVSPHVYLWGFPDIVYTALAGLPEGTELVAWLTWYYKNCPSVIRGWRSAQYTCLHIARKKAKLYPEHFLNDAQKKLREQGKLRYLPGPPSVIEAPLNIGFVGRAEQTGHPSQKPISVMIPLIEMVTKPGDIVLDPMCGSGTTGIAAYRLERNSILCDASVEYLGIARMRVDSELNGAPHPKPQVTSKKSRKKSNATLFSESDND